MRQEYLDELARQFGVAAVEADFASEPEEARSAINTWVSERTHHLIPELFEKGTIHPGVVLVLVNGLYLKAAWTRAFDVDATETPFTTAAGQRTRVRLMRTPMPVPGTAGKGWVSASPGYVAPGLAMTVLVPDDLSKTMRDLDADLIAEASTTDRSWALRMPAFKVSCSPDVRTAVIDMGVTDLFDASADLSGIAGAPGHLYAESFVHQAIVQVDKDGTEAVAATGMTVMESATVAGRELLVDRPFLFWIHEDTTGAPLFLGVVGDPTAN